MDRAVGYGNMKYNGNTMEHIEYAYTSGLDTDEIEHRLQTTHTGVLSLAYKNEAYAVPLAHYYDGDRLYFRVGRREQSEKWKYIEKTNTACYTVYHVTPTDEPRELTTWSISLTGQLIELPEAERERFDTAEVNRCFAPIRVFDEPIESIEIVLLEFEIESMTGRTTLTEG